VRPRLRPRSGAIASGDPFWHEGDGAVAGSAAPLGAACELAPAVLGAVTAAEDPAFSPGVYTGGSRSTVYSRIRWPRAQLTSTRKVTKGSGIESVERTIKTSWPSLLLPTLKVNEVRNGGRSMPYRVKASRGARLARRAVSSSGVAAMMSMSAFNGSFRPEFR
jgi:hypothetical protein